ncbi:unnamed protein product [Fraxinus pennsylvanica]|uniref:BFN domain-containing protein n=1 Tax=Fraxinus pennsylvanica TaxID=56036 RepID=A0AAD1YRB9_9LAMI|nr:unnamed protein product [Fraxinus pennsylvanica]
MGDGTGLLLPIIALEMQSVLLMEAIRNVQIARPTREYTRHIFAQLHLTKLYNEAECVRFDLRPSDAIDIAVRCKVPIQVNKYLVYADGMRIIEFEKVSGHSSSSDGSFPELDSSVEGQAHSTPLKEELDIVIIMSSLFGTTGG